MWAKKTFPFQPVLLQKNLRSFLFQENKELIHDLYSVHDVNILHDQIGPIVQ